MWHLKSNIFLELALWCSTCGKYTILECTSPLKQMGYRKMFCLLDNHNPRIDIFAVIVKANLMQVLYIPREDAISKLFCIYTFSTEYFHSLKVIVC